jgi:hypothetical protein
LIINTVIAMAKTSLRQIYERETVMAPDAITRLSPTPTVRAVARRPYQSIDPELSDSMVSQIWTPEIEAAPENGPNVAADPLVADPAGDCAAPKIPVCRA